MRTRTVTFEECSLHPEKTCKCSVCGKRLRRTKRLWKTVNPFNRHPDGRVKTREDLYAELMAEAEEWKRQPETCRNCATAA